MQAQAELGLPDRPPWQWSVFGGVLIVLLWVLFAAVSLLLVRGPDATGPGALVLHMTSQTLASLVVGVVVGTWSPRRGITEAAMAGGLSVLFAVACSAATAVASNERALPWSTVLGGLVLLPTATLGAAFGAWLGNRKKRVLTEP